MQRRRSVLLILMLLAGSLSPPAVRGQELRSAISAERPRLFSLEQNHPNPVNPETWIPFSLEEELFETHDSVLVTMRIFNVLRQVVAIPDAVDHPRGSRVRISNAAYRSPGRKVAYWNGRDLAGRRVPTGVYYCQLEVNGETVTQKVIVDNPRRRRNIIPWFGRQ